jgi:hypothetical protein
MEKHIDNLIKIQHSLEWEIQCAQDKLESYTENLKNIKAFLLDCCPHQWVTDYIDIDIEHGEQITICNKCLSTKPAKFSN